MNKYKLQKQYKKFIRAIKMFYKWNIIGKSLPKRERRRISFIIMEAFDGYYIENMVEEPSLFINLNSFSIGLTNLRYRLYNNRLIVEISLRRPGLLIGKGGRTIDKFKEHLNKQLDWEVDLRIIETKL